MSNEEKFWDKVDVCDPDECWEWQASTKSRGYGQMWFPKDGERHNWYSHRLAYHLENGGIPEGKQVNHTCDNVLCVNPNHLYAGTQSENIRDKSRRDRHNRDRWNGAKLTIPEVKEIKERVENESQTALGVEFGVSKQAIHSIAHGETYEYVEVGEEQL